MRRTKKNIEKRTRNVKLPSKNNIECPTRNVQLPSKNNIECPTRNVQLPRPMSNEKCPMPLSLEIRHSLLDIRYWLFLVPSVVLLNDPGRLFRWRSAGPRCTKE